MNWIVVFCVWAMLLVLFLIANKRWGDRMAKLDADMEQAVNKPQQRIVSAGVRPYPE